MYGTFLYEGKAYDILDALNFKGFKPDDYSSEAKEPFLEWELHVTYQLNDDHRLIVKNLSCQNLFGTYPKINGVWPDCDENGVEVLSGGFRTYSNVDLELYDSATLLLADDRLPQDLFRNQRLLNYRDVKEITLIDGILVSVLDHSRTVQEIQKVAAENEEFSKWLSPYSSLINPHFLEV